MPDCAVTRAGSVRVRSASRNTRFGRSGKSITVYFAWVFGSLTTATIVVSEPVPAVVGIA